MNYRTFFLEALKSGKSEVEAGIEATNKLVRYQREKLKGRTIFDSRNPGAINVGWKFNKINLEGWNSLLIFASSNQNNKSYNMKKILFVLAVLFAFSTTASAETTTNNDKRPKSGYNYKKNAKKAARYNFFHRPHKNNGGCGWAKATR